MKNLIITFTLCLSYSITGAQVFQWRQQLSGNAPSNFSYVNDMATDASGNTYVVGSFYGNINFGNGNETSVAIQSAYLVKYDANGNFQYLKKIGGTQFAEVSIRGVSLTTDSNGIVFILITGFHTSYNGQILTNNFNLSNTGATPINLTMNDTAGDQFIAKYNAFSGVCVWAKNVPNTTTGITNDIGPKISTDNLGNSYLINSFSNRVYKFNSSGVEVWNQLVTQGGGAANNIEFKNDKVFICGYGLGPNSQPIVWLDSNGNFIAGTGDSLYSFASISIDNTTGDIYVAGSRSIGGGTRQMVVRRYFVSPNGSPVWSQVFPSNLTSPIIDLTAAKHTPSNVNEIVVVGWFKGTVNFNNGLNNNFTISSSNSGNHSNIFAARYNASTGQCAWVRNSPSNTQNGQSNPIAVSSFTNNFYLSGNVMYRTIDVDFCSPTVNVVADNAENGFVAKYLISPSSPVLTSPSIVCVSGGSFVVSNLGSGATATWSVSPANFFVTSSGSGSTATLVAKPGFSGTATITFYFTGVDGCGIPLPSSINKSFWTGPPIGGISGPSVVYPQQNYFYSNETPTSIDGGFNYTWSIYGGYFNGINYNTAIAFWNESGTIVLDYENLCGTKHSEMEVTVDLGGGCNPCNMMQSYPNPTSSILNIKFINEESSNELKEITLVNKDQKSFFHVTTRSKEIEISTTEIPDGQYYLITKYGDKKESKQISIKH